MMYLAFCTHIIHIYIYIQKFIISLSHPEKLVNLQALHLWLRSLLRRWAAAAQLLQRRRQRSTAAWEAANMARIPYIYYTNIYIYIIFWNVALIVFLVSLPHFFTCQRPYYLCSLFVCILYLFSDDFCISLLPSSNARFPHTSSLRQALRERRLHGSIQGERSQQWTWDVLTFNDISSSFLAGWHLWATSSASRQRCQRDLTVLG